MIFGVWTIAHLFFKPKLASLCGCLRSSPQISRLAILLVLSPMTIRLGSSPATYHFLQFLAPFWSTMPMAFKVAAVLAALSLTGCAEDQSSRLIAEGKTSICCKGTDFSGNDLECGIQGAYSIG